MGVGVMFGVWCLARGVSPNAHTLARMHALSAAVRGGSMELISQTHLLEDRLKKRRYSFLRLFDHRLSLFPDSVDLALPRRGLKRGLAGGTQEDNFLQVAPLQHLNGGPLLCPFPPCTR